MTVTDEHLANPRCPNALRRGYRVIAALVSALDARKNGMGYMARCPAHDDRNPSLAITEKNGKVLLHCFAGCSQISVISALKGLGVWESKPNAKQRKAARRIVAVYDYTDESRALLYQVVRYEPKGFTQRRPHPESPGSYIYSLKNADGAYAVRFVLYRLPEVMENSIVFIVEGEKDVETVRSYGFVATTNAMGADNWRDEFNEVFAGKNVYIIPDNDRPGMMRALQIARGVRLYAKSVNVITLDGAKDISDWFERGHSEIELIGLMEGRNV